MKLHCLVAAALLLLSGCDKAVREVSNHLEKSTAGMKVVLPAGHSFDIAGVSTPVFGRGLCPSSRSTLLGSDSIPLEHRCIVLDPQSAVDQVEVMYREPQGALVREMWQVVHEKVSRHGMDFPTVQLRRPDGSWAISSQTT